MRVIELNLNHCQAAPNLLVQKVFEKKIDVAFFSEKYESLHQAIWETGVSEKAALWACGNLAVQQAMKHREHDFVRSKHDDPYFYGCYAAPSIATRKYCYMLGDANEHNPDIFAGDFNALGRAGKFEKKNERERILLKVFSYLTC